MIIIQNNDLISIYIYIYIYTIYTLFGVMEYLKILTWCLKMLTVHGEFIFFPSGGDRLSHSLLHFQCAMFCMPLQSFSSASSPETALAAVVPQLLHLPSPLVTHFPP